MIYVYMTGATLPAFSYLYANVCKLLVSKVITAMKRRANASFKEYECRCSSPNKISLENMTRGDNIRLNTTIEHTHTNVHDRKKYSPCQR